MTLLFADGLESGSAAWSLSTQMVVGTGRFGNGLVANNVNTNAIAGFAAGSAGPYILGMAFKPPSALACGIVSLLEAGATQIGVGRGGSGEIILYRSGSYTVIATSATGVLPASAWSYVEIKASIHDTTGIGIIRVNGVEVINFVGDTKPGTELTINTIRLGANGTMGNTANAAWDDIYVCDTTGSVNNDFLGELMVEHLIPGSDDTAQWVGSDGNSTANYDLVNETGAYNSADYVATSTVGQRDLYIPVASSRPITSPVKGVIVSAIAQKTDAGTRTAKLVIKEGPSGTERLSAEMGLPTSFGELRALWDRKADGSAWTVADVNALRFGIEVVS